MKLLRREDIERLISMWVPVEEYGPEAVMIVSRLREAESNAPSHRVTREEVESIISAVWKETFGLSEDQLHRRHNAFRSVVARLAT
jgi:hypothetical protein